MSDAPRIRRAPVAKMPAVALLAEYASIQRWFGDDFSISQPTTRDYARSDAVEAEILRRLGGAA